MKDFTYKLGALLIAGIGLFTACEKDHGDEDPEDDKTSPSIEILAPSPNEVFLPGDTINYSIKFIDQGGLGMYDIDLRQTQKIARMAEDDPVDFARYTTGNNIGYTQIVEGSHIIPLGAYAGTYTYTVGAMDHVENEAEPETVDIFISSEIENVPPVIAFTSPEDLSQYTIGDMIDFSAIITDNIKLTEVSVSITQNATDFAPYSAIFTEEMITAGNSMSIALQLPVLDTYPRGTYSAKIVATDLSGNVTRDKLTFIVHYPLEEEEG